MVNSATAQVKSADVDLEQDLRSSVDESEIVPLLVALFLKSGDLKYLDERFKPDLVVPAVGGKPHGGLTGTDLEAARTLAVQGILELGVLDQSGSVQPNDEMLSAALEFLTGEGNDEYLPVVKRELGLNGDVESPVHTGYLSGWTGQAVKDVAVIGAGVSGILVATRLAQAGVPFTIFEKNQSIGGTWYENRYPGCRLDTSNFGYSYTFKQHNWQHYFSTQQEIEEYLAQVAVDRGLLQHTQLSTEVQALTWTGDSWQVDVLREGKESSRTFSHVITAVGQLNRPKIPEIPGAQQFIGKQWHSAQWPEDFALEGKRVAVVGTGASAYQIVPAIAGSVAELAVFQRNAPWILPTPGYSQKLPQGFKNLLEQFPEYGRVLRFYQFWTGLEGRRRFAVVDPAWTKPDSVSAINEEFREALTEAICQQFSDRPDLAEKLIPSYPPAGKRILRDDGDWARALKQPNVELVTEGIESLTPTGIRTNDGIERDFDAIVYATGFKVDKFLSPIRVQGVDGVELADVWQEDAESYLGMHIAGFPNLMMLYGPNTNLVVNGSVVFLVECAVNRVFEILDHQEKNNFQFVDVSKEVVEEFTESLDAGNRGMAWGDARTDTWYKGKSGRVVSVWPFSMLRYWQETHNVDFNKLQFK